MPDTVRSTIYIDAALHRALRLKAAATHRSLSELVNQAVRSALRDNEENLATFAEREGERSISYEELLDRLREDFAQYVREAALAQEPRAPEESGDGGELASGLDPVPDQLWGGPGAGYYRSRREGGAPMRATVSLDEALLARAESLTGMKERNVLIGEALKALIERESARRLARLGGSEPAIAPIPRRRSDPV